MDRTVTSPPVRSLLSAEGTAGSRERTPARRLLRGAVPYVLSTASVALALLASLTLEGMGFRTLEFPLFLFAIASTVWYPGMGPAIVAVVLSTLAFDYYFTEPRYTFTIAPKDIPYFVTFVLFAAMLTGFSVVRRRTERQLLESREQMRAEIAERQAREEHIQKLNDQLELAHLARVITMGEMATSIAHEVNQPLSAIVLNGKACFRWLSRESPDLGEACAAAERIIGDATRAGDVIARVRGLTRKAATHKARLDLNETIEQVVVLVRAELHKHGVALRMELRRDLAPVLGDRVQLQQVLLNLFLNAIEAMSAAAGRLRELVVATADHDATQALVSVRDTGAGLDPQLRDRVFDAFYTTKPGGMGMGLAICRSIVQDHGGRLWAEANDGPGATFRFTLPKAS